VRRVDTIAAVDHCEHCPRYPLPAHSAWIAAVDCGSREDDALPDTYSHPGASYFRGSLERAPMTPESPPLDEEAVRGMVRDLQPNWRVDTIDPIEYGLDYVAVLKVETPDGNCEAVLKAATADHSDPATVRAEPRLFELFGRDTDVPVPTVHGYRDHHEDYPAPFSLTEYVAGENYEGAVGNLDTAVRERTLRDAGRYLAPLHERGSYDRAGRIGVRDGEMRVLDGDGHTATDAFHDWLLAAAEHTLDCLADGGYFSEMADDRERFADLVPDLRSSLADAIPDLSDPERLTYCHKDYRYGNFLVDPETGAIQAVLDWGIVVAAPPSFNLASAESLLLSPDADPPARTAALRETFRSAYADARDDWTFDESTRERMRLYRLTCRLDAMACLPLWHEDATPAERDERAAEHRAFVAEYLDE